MAKYNITTTKTGMFRVESLFQRVGTFRTMAAAEAAMGKEDARQASIRAAYDAALKAGGGYHAVMAATMAAEAAWRG